MNKTMKRLMCLTMACFTAFPLVACGDDEGGNGEQKHNPEETALVLSTDALDGKFNPFYATSATDVTIAAQTQISMLSLDANANIVCGENEPTVALDYKETMYDVDGNVVKGTTDKEIDRTEYEFVIKNGIKYSDGDDLTIDDVLFNLYVYLDPMYMGSSTIYSTKIQGLAAYREQNPGADNTGSTNLRAQYYAEADTRIGWVLCEYCGVTDETLENTNPANGAKIAEYYEKAKEFFQEEVESDWSAIGSIEDYQKEYKFTELWEAYYLNSGIIKIQTNKVGNVYVPVKDGDKYLTTLDNDEGAHYKTAMQTALAGLEKDSTEYNDTMRQTAIETVYKNYVDEELMNPDVLRYWATGERMREEIAAELLEEHYKEVEENGAGVSSISGITTYNTKNKAFGGGKMGSKLDSEGHDVLKIVIDNVDPKAIYNFAFSVAPMHYYGDGEGVYDDYYKKANRTDNFGVAFGEKDFFDKVLQAPAKSGFPVGAGAYKAWGKNDSGTKNDDTFWDNGVVYYTRNEYFETVGKELHNAKIKKLRYQEIGSDMLMDALKAGTVHFGTPNASPTNIEDLNKYTDRLTNEHFPTNGYGYVGVNAKHVPNIQIRRIIMKTMNLDSPQSYYGSLSSKLYRSMSLTSDYYPTVEGVMGGTDIATSYKGVDTNFYAGDLTSYWEMETSGMSKRDFAIKTINEYLDNPENNVGYETKNGEGIRVNADGEALKYTFTIAGGSDDHPAYAMFQRAADILNNCGFKITIITDPQALIKLASGELQVWAAAWQSAIDPDMYQVYHKDSTASSVKNWGYDEIFKPKNADKYAEEISIIGKLSTFIEQGRQTTNPNDRFAAYTQALDLVMELAVELPIYQRRDLYVYDNTLIDSKTLNQNPSTNSGLLDRIWEVNYL